MIRRRSWTALAFVVLIGSPAASSRAQAPADTPLPGAGLTRQQIIDTLAAPDYKGKRSAADGKVLYEGLCGHCHLFGDIGTSVGPDLSTVSSRFRTRDLLDAILFPSRTISDQYAMTTLTLDDGSAQSGLIAREDARFVYLLAPDRPGGRGVPVPLTRITGRRDAGVSMMPDSLVAGLTLEQIDSLVAFLLGGK